MKISLKSFCLSVAIALSLPGPVSAQVEAPLEKTPASATEQKPVEQPWLYRGSDVPVDKSWTFGELKNGLRYAVKRNDVPADQVSIRVRIDAGALHEREDELGFAHLIEHLAFRGSTHVPDGEAKRIWQRFGVTFGSDSNAQTTPTQTVYKLDLPNARSDRLAESMKILSGMIREPRISKTALDAERDIVLAELREGSGAALNYSNKLREHLFQGQRLSKRATIGTPETLKAADATRLAAFHRRWYRPDNTVVVIAGDADPATLAALVEEYYGDWEGEGAKIPEPDFGQPFAGDKADLIIEPTLPTVATIAWLRPWYLKDDTIIYNEGLLINVLTTLIINRRLETAARNGASFIFANVQQDDQARSADATFVTIQPIDGNWEEAVRDVRAIIADAVERPPSQADIDREKQLFIDALRTGVDSYRFEAAAKQADDIVSAVDIRETVATPQTVVDVFAAMDGKLTPERLQQSAKTLFSADATRIFLSAPKTQDKIENRLLSALTVPVQADAGARLAGGSLTIDDLPKLGKPGTIISSTTNDRFEIETVVFANGVRALLNPNKVENGQIRMLVRFGKGYQAFTPNTGGLLWTGEYVLGENGIGNLGRTELDQIINGRRIVLDFSIDNDAFQFSSTTRPQDLPDQLRIIAAKLEHPGWASGPVERAKALAKSGYDSFEMSAGSVLQRDLEYLTRGKDMRWKSATPEAIAELDARSFRKFWSPMLAQGPIEVIIFGDFERADAVKALSETFGAMKPRKKTSPTSDGLKLQFPKGDTSPVKLTHKGPKDQVAAVIAWPTGGGLDRITESRELEVLAAIFRDRLFEKFRAEQAASYSPDMTNNWPDDFPDGGYLMAYTQVRPEDVDSFYRFAEEVADDLIARPVSADELKRAVEPIKQYVERASSGNTFWLQQLKGAAHNPLRFTALSHLYSDYSRVTSARIQQLAARYFRDEKSWKLTVVPEKMSAD